MKYEVLKKFGKIKAGQILDSDREEDNKIIKRKIVEIGTLKELSCEKENKMDKKNYENKGVGK